jgi:hypothetical protein
MLYFDSKSFDSLVLGSKTKFFTVYPKFCSNAEFNAFDSSAQETHSFGYIVVN